MEIRFIRENSFDSERNEDDLMLPFASVRMFRHILFVTIIIRRKKSDEWLVGQEKSSMKDRKRGEDDDDDKLRTE